MSEYGDIPSRWQLIESDREILHLLASAIREIAPMARSGGELIAIGEAWAAIEEILEEDPVVVNVGLKVGYCRGDRDFNEGRFMCFRVNADEIVLDELNTTYSSAVGGDHFTVKHAYLSVGGGFDEIAVVSWIGQLEQARSEEDATVMAERDHI